MNCGHGTMTWRQENGLWECPEGCTVSSIHIIPIPSHERGKGDSKPTNPKDIIGSDKLPLSLVPDTAIAYATLGHLEGMLKYGLMNWREAGVRTSIYLDALARHIAKFKNGEWEDPVTKVPHLGNALACINILIDAYECGKLVDDRPKSAPVAALIDRFSEKVKHLKRLFASSEPVDYLIGGPTARRERGAGSSALLAAPGASSRQE